MVTNEEAMDDAKTISGGRDYSETSRSRSSSGSGQECFGSLSADLCDGQYVLWRKEYGGIGSDQAKRLKERGNARLKKLVAEAELDKAILREEASGNF